MKSIGAIIVGIIVLLVLSGCETLAERVTDKEDLLAAAGFNVLPANTKERLKSLKTLPANKFVSKTEENSVKYIYADPVVCNCLYVGDQTAYNAYKKEVFDRNILNQEEMDAQMYEDNWGWGGWGWWGF